jgi:hypothetical protein
MKRSRRDVLRAGAACLATASVAGCIEERVTRRETRVTDTSSWTLSPATEASLDEQAFENYTERMENRYDDSGVWGRTSEQPDDLEVAYVQRYAITRETPGSPTNSDFSLVPEAVDPEAPVLIADACLAGYEVGENRYRYWLWIAADPTDGRLVENVSLTALSTGLRLKRGSIADVATPSASGGEASVELGSPPAGPSGTFPARGGSFETTSVRGADGIYVTKWGGQLEESQSTSGVCEVDRDGEYDFTWTMSLGYSSEETA